MSDIQLQSQNEASHTEEEKNGESDPIVGLCAVLAEYQPEITALLTSATDNYVKILEKQRSIQEEKNKFHQFIVVERRWLTVVIVAAIVFIVCAIIWLTSIGKFEGTTFAFFLGTSVGSLLVILGKILAPKE